MSYSITNTTTPSLCPRLRAQRCALNGTRVQAETQTAPMCLTNSTRTPTSQAASANVIIHGKAPGYRQLPHSITQSRHRLWHSDPRPLPREGYFLRCRAVCSSRSKTGAGQSQEWPPNRIHRTNWISTVRFYHADRNQRAA